MKVRLYQYRSSSFETFNRSNETQMKSLSGRVTVWNMERVGVNYSNPIDNMHVCVSDDRSIVGREKYNQGES